MSIVALKRNSRRYKAVVSGRGADGFSLNGGYRNQGRVGQILFGRHLGGTPFRGAHPVGYGATPGGGAYPIVISSAGGCCTNNPDIIKRSSMTTRGRIETGLINPVPGKYRNPACAGGHCRQIWSADLSAENQAQSLRIQRMAIAAAGRVTRKPDAGKVGCKDCGPSPGRIGTHLNPRTPYAKDLNAFPVSQGQYLRGAYMLTKDLPTPPCKAPFPPRLNGAASCAVHAKTLEEAQQLGIVPKEPCGKPCGPPTCYKPGRPHKEPAVSQDIATNTPLPGFSASQRALLAGQRVGVV